jgi:hypothetical protein
MMRMMTLGTDTTLPPLSLPLTLSSEEQQEKQEGRHHRSCVLQRHTTPGNNINDRLEMQMRLEADTYVHFFSPFFFLIIQTDQAGWRIQRRTMMNTKNGSRDVAVDIS